LLKNTLLWGREKEAITIKEYRKGRMHEIYDALNFDINRNMFL
jgi:hypothetical protein